MIFFVSVCGIIALVQGPVPLRGNILKVGWEATGEPRESNEMMCPNPQELNPGPSSGRPMSYHWATEHVHLKNVHITSCMWTPHCGTNT